MKTLKDKIIKSVTKGVMLGAAAIMMYGCNGGSSGSGSGTEIIAPAFGADNCPSVVNENTSGECQLNVTGTDPITYSINSAGAIVVDPSTGKVTWNSPEVPQDTAVTYTAKACNSAGCTTQDREITVKDVPAGENAHPLIQGLVLGNGASFDGNNIYQTWGKDIEGSVVATDAEDDFIEYNVGFSGEGLYSGYQNEEAFGVSTYSQNRTDATADLGQVLIEAWDEGGRDTKTVGVVGKNPISATSNLFFNENGTYGITSDATSDGSFLDKAELYVNGVHESSVDKTFGDVSSDYADYDNIPIVNGENTNVVKYFNDDGDERDVGKGFTPASEEEWRTIMRERLADWGFVEGVGGYLEDNTIAVDGNSNPGCTIPSGTTQYITPDFTIFSNGNLATANYTSPTDNKTTDLENYNKLKYCGNINNDLQMTMYPAYEIYNRIDEFHDLGFTFE